MIAAGAYQLSHRGLLSHVTLRCGSLSAAFTGAGLLGLVEQGQPKCSRQFHRKHGMHQISTGLDQFDPPAAGRRWGLWGAWRAAEALSCHALALGDALGALGVLLAAPWLLYRSGLLRWAGGVLTLALAHVGWLAGEAK
jgi:hypothetical protein